MIIQLYEYHYRYTAVSALSYRCIPGTFFQSLG